jgi:tRNA(Ile)-lysidine synthase
MIKGTSLFSNVGIAETYLEKNGIDIVVANELLPERARFYEFLHPKTDVVTGDITKKEVFDEVVKKYDAKYLMTAHHGDDLIETILMRISRGSDLKGYAGFDLVTPKENYCVIKPLIFTTKENIEKYNKKNNIPSVEDLTNKSLKYTRNRYRHNVLPFLKEENPEVHLKYLKYSQELQKYYSFVAKIVEKEMHKRYENNILDLNDILNVDDFIIENIIKRILDINYPDNLYLVSDKHTQMIKELIYNKKPNIQLNLPNNIIIKKRYNKMIITKDNKNDSDYNIKITKKTILPNSHTINIIDESAETSNYYTRLNSKELSLPLYVRNRKPGDKMTIKNSTGSKKIKDILIDNKIEIEKRNSLPIVVDSKNNIVWLPGLKKSKFDKAKTEEYDIILWYN